MKIELLEGAQNTILEVAQVCQEVQGTAHTPVSSNTRVTKMGALLYYQASRAREIAQDQVLSNSCGRQMNIDTQA